MYHQYLNIYIYKRYIYFFLFFFFFVAVHSVWPITANSLQFNLANQKQAIQFAGNCPITDCHFKEMSTSWAGNGYDISTEIMSFPSYALFYFPDSDMVKVDSTDIILREHRRVEYQVSSHKQIRSEEGYIEVRLTSRGRHGQTKILAAKILLLGGKLSLLLLPISD